MSQKFKQRFEFFRKLFHPLQAKAPRTHSMINAELTKFKLLPKLETKKNLFKKQVNFQNIPKVFFLKLQKLFNPQLPTSFDIDILVFTIHKLMLVLALQKQT